MRNKQVAHEFAHGATRGYSNNMKIIGDTLYSYESVIAVRCGKRGNEYFKITNRTSTFRGHAYTVTTSCHISYAIDECVPHIFVDGWADKSKPRWFPPPSHKTIGGLVRAFTTGYGSMVNCWYGKYKLLRIEHDCLYHKNTMIARRRYCYSENMDVGNNHCEYENMCPARFICYTQRGGYFGHIFFLREEPKGNGKIASALRNHIMRKHPTVINDAL